MKYLLLSTGTNLTRRRINIAHNQIGITPVDRIDLVSLHPGAKPLPVHRHWVLDPSVVPGRTAMPVQTLRRRMPQPRFGTPRRLLNKAYRSWRSVAGVVPTVPAMRFSPRTQLAVACNSSSSVWRVAADADVLVALDDAAVYGAWLLAQRFPHLTAVNHPGGVGAVLRAQSEAR